MSNQNHQPRPSRRRKGFTAAAVFAGLFTFYAPVANAGELLLYGGIPALFGHPYAGTYFRASDYIRTPRRNYVPAIETPYRMMTDATFVPYRPNLSGDSAVYNTPIASKRGHGTGSESHSVYRHPAGHDTKFRHRSGTDYIR